MPKISEIEAELLKNFEQGVKKKLFEVSFLQETELHEWYKTMAQELHDRKFAGFIRPIPIELSLRSQKNMDFIIRIAAYYEKFYGSYKMVFDYTVGKLTPCKSVSPVIII